MSSLKTFFKICELLNSKVLYIPELVFDNEYSNILKKEIFPKVKIITEEYKNVEYCDLYNVINYDKEKFIDKMHFSKTGSDVFSELLKNIILKKFL